MKYCTNCGKEVKKEYKFCPRCGVSVINEKSDSLYDNACEFVVDYENISVAMLQKEFKLSYTNASKLIKELEKNKIVGPANGRKGRKVLIEKNNSKENKDNIKDRLKKELSNIMNTKEYTTSYTSKDINDNLFLALLSYVGLLAFIPYFFSNESKYVKYHATQGMNLLIIWVLYTITNELLSLIKVSKVVVDFGNMVGTKMVTPLWISLPMNVISLGLVLISISGIVYVCQGKAKELPLIGKIKIVK